MFKKPLIPLITFLIVAVIIYISHSLAPVKFISGIVQSIFAEPKAFIYSLKTGNSDSDEIKKLKQENEELKKKLVELERTKRDNEALRSQFEGAENIVYELMPARVLGASGAIGFPTTLIIDKGSGSNIKMGAAVIIKNNLIGKIGKVAPRYSQVLLLFNSNFSTIAKTAETNSRGVVRGNNDFLLLERVAVTDKINEEGILLTAGETSGLGIGIPPDLLIGKITSVNRSPSLPFQTAKIESSIQFDKLENVFIVMGLK